MAVIVSDISVSTAVTLISILIIIYVLVLAPMSLFYARQLWILNKRNIPFITKRHPRVVILSVLYSNFYIIIIRPITDITALYGLQSGLSNLSSVGMIIITLRVWLLFFDYNHALHTLALKWQTQITREIPTHIPWTARYKWMGDLKILFIITAILSIVVLTTTIICHVIFGAVSLYYTRITIALLFMIFMAILIFNVRSCRDEFYIQKEFKLLLLYVTISVVIFASFQPFVGRDSNMNVLLGNILISITSYILVFVQTYWVIRQYSASKELEIPTLNIGSGSAGSVGTPSSVSKLQSGGIHVAKLPLEDILKTKDGFDVFANHLIREFSIENLFFIYEVIQAKNEMLQKSLVNREDIGYMLSFDLQHIDQIRRPNSSVDDVNDLRSTVRYIMGQYMRYDATYSVNVSGDTRMSMLDAYNQLEGGGKLVVEAPIEIIYDEDEARYEDSPSDGEQTVDFGKINERELNRQYIVLFDNAMREIIFLLKNDSLKRFYKTVEYRTMMQKYNK